MECAIWYWRYSNICYELCDSEQEAAEDANSIEDSGEGSVVGVQRADGSFTPRDEWDAYKAEGERRMAELDEWAKEAAARPKPATREVAPPFDAPGQTVSVPLDAPPWLGR